MRLSAAGRRKMSIWTNLLNYEGKFVYLPWFCLCRPFWLGRHSSTWTVGNETFPLPHACNHFASNVLCSLLIDVDIDLASQRQKFFVVSELVVSLKLSAHVLRRILNFSIPFTPRVKKVCRARLEVSRCPWSYIQFTVNDSRD